MKTTRRTIWAALALAFLGARANAQDAGQVAAADAEAEQQRAATAEQQRRDLPTKRPSFAHARLSALLCYAAGERRIYKGRIDEQRRGARIGGVIDKERVYEAQQEIVAMDELERSAKREMKAIRAVAIDCRKINRTELGMFFSCIDEQRNDAVDDPAAESVDQIMTASVSCAAERNF